MIAVSEARRTAIGSSALFGVLAVWLAAVAQWQIAGLAAVAGLAMGLLASDS